MISKINKSLTLDNPTTQLHYWITQLCMVVLGIVIVGLYFLSMVYDSTILFSICVFLVCLTSTVEFSIAFNRLHTLGINPYYALLTFIPYLSLTTVFIIGCLRSGKSNDR